MQGSVWELYCSLSICLNLFRFRASACFAYDKTVLHQRRVEKSAFEIENQSEEISMWVLKWGTLLGIFCKISFMPAVTSCYQIHARNAETHIPIWDAAMLLYVSLVPRTDPGRGDWGDRPPKTYIRNFSLHDFVQFGKQHSRYKVILTSIVLSQQCCKVYLMPLAVVNS